MTPTEGYGGFREPFGAPERDASRDHVPGGVVVRVLVVVCVVTVVLCTVAALLLRMEIGRWRPSRRFPEARLPVPSEVSGVRQWPFEDPRRRPSAAVRRRERLERFGWVDERRRVVSIPIERGMDLVVQEHAARREDRR
jgi:hypothetical protein